MLTIMFFKIPLENIISREFHEEFYSFELVHIIPPTRTTHIFCFFFPHTHYSLPIFHVITAKRRVKLYVLSAVLHYIPLFDRRCFILIYIIAISSLFSRIVIVQTRFYFISYTKNIELISICTAFSHFI